MCCLVPPLFNDSLAQIKIQALINTTTEFICSAYGFPKPSIQWSFNTNLFTEKLQTEDRLIIENVQVNNCRRKYQSIDLFFFCYLDQRYGNV